MATPQTKPAKADYRAVLHARATQLAAQLQACPPAAVADALYETLRATALQSWNNGRSAGRAQAHAEATAKRKHPST